MSVLSSHRRVPRIKLRSSGLALDAFPNTEPSHYPSAFFFFFLAVLGLPSRDVGHQHMRGTWQDQTNILELDGVIF